MKNFIISALKFAIPLGVGIFLIWYVYSLLSPNEKEELFDAMERANYWWIALSIFLGILSHLSRAYRWKYLLQPLNYNPRFLNSFFSVMTGYLINLLVPRLGEITRCGVMSRYEKIPFNKLFGTVIAERIADLTILTILTLSVILAQLSTLKDLLYSIIPNEISGNTIILICMILFVSALVIIRVLYVYLKNSTKPFAIKIKSLIQGFLDGLKSIIEMENRVLFILHTLFIWLMYFAMFYLCFFSLEETSDIPIVGVLAAFVMGGISIIFIQGGIGVYPAAIMEVLFLYEIIKPTGLALGWIIWISQTAMLIVMGVLSLLLISRYNKSLKTKL
ncbi:MAG TPA: flippase-like domain-containing protein [Flavobacteriales bacterium]|nr:flippase-like domain-containing protein [Flavobacteriales bacterium]